MLVNSFGNIEKQLVLNVVSSFGNIKKQLLCTITMKNVHHISLLYETITTTPLI